MLKFLVLHHGQEFPGLSSTTHLYQMEGEQAELAVRHLDNGFSEWNFP